MKLALKKFRSYEYLILFMIWSIMWAPKNEFDGILLTDDGIITIDIKSTQPTMKQLEKLDSFSKHLSPIRGNSNFLIYNWVWENNPKGVKKRRDWIKQSKIVNYPFI